MVGTMMISIDPGNSGQFVGYSQVVTPTTTAMGTMIYTSGFMQASVVEKEPGITDLLKQGVKNEQNKKTHARLLFKKPQGQQASESTESKTQINSP